MSVETQTVYTFRDILRDTDKRLELIEGVVVEMPPSRRRNTIIAGLIAHFLNAYVLPRGLGYITVADGGFEVNDSNTFQPDVAFIQKARVATLDGVAFDLAPDLAVEVISPSETTRQIHHKVITYLQGGTEAVWIVYPDEQMVEVWTLNAEAQATFRTLTAQDVLESEEVESLRGFSVPVADIFPAG